MNFKKCLVCTKDINLDKDKYVLLGTYNGLKKSKKSEDYFHFSCWIDYFNQKIIDRIAFGQDQAMKILSGSLKNLKIKVQDG
jgi:hypothetical protein